MTRLPFTTIRSMGEPSEFERLRGELEEVFADLCGPQRTGRQAGFRPRLNMYRTDDPPALTVVVELAGVDPDAIELSVAGRALVVAGRRTREAPATASYRHMELDYGPFERHVPLEDDLDTERIDASYERGLLRITIPAAPPRPRKVSVPVGRKERP